MRIGLSLKRKDNVKELNIVSNMAKEFGATIEGAKRKSANEVFLKLSFTDPLKLREFLEKYDYRFGTENTLS